MQLVPRLLGALLVVTISACSTLEVSSDHDPSADFSKFKTFGWDTAKNAAASSDPRTSNPLLHKRIVNTVEQALLAKGFSKAGGSTPDFYLGYHVAVNDRVSVSSMNNYYGYAPGWGWNYAYAGGVDVYQYEEGSLVLDIVDAQTHKLVWRGTAQAEVNQFDKQEKKDRRIQQAVDRMLATFPPGAKPASQSSTAQ